MKLEPESFAGRTLVAFGFRLLQLWLLTIRYKFEDRGDVTRTPLSQPLIGAAWHNRLLLLPFMIARFLPRRPGVGLISKSQDGAWISQVVKRVGFGVVRGSSSRRGASAILELAEVIASGRNVLITPDGPRGPAYRLGGGTILLAQKTGTQILPINLEYSSCWRLKSWDRFVLPRPFSRVRFILGPVESVAPTTTEEEFERERVRIQSAIMALVEMR